MMWYRLIIVDKGRTQFYDVNGGKLVVASIRSILNGAVRGITFDEVEYAASKFDKIDGVSYKDRDGHIQLLGYSTPRRLLTMYADEFNGIQTVYNTGLNLSGWLRHDFILELESLIEMLKEGRI